MGKSKKPKVTSINYKLGFAFLIALLIPTLLIAFTSYSQINKCLLQPMN
ncbi:MULTISPECIES: hypothetical protein [unclassified Lysinibacillus]|nr:MULTISPECIES: hypothetical protein [unclassified Lysinibacillus]